jgi:hypothetical protein
MINAQQIEAASSQIRIVPVVVCAAASGYFDRVSLARFCRVQNRWSFLLKARLNVRALFPVIGCASGLLLST